MDFLKAEIASKKRQLGSYSPSPGPADSSSSDHPTKYLKRSELERIRREEEEREQRIKEEERRAKLYGKKPASTSSTSRPSASSSINSPLPGSPAPPDSNSTDLPLATKEAEEKFFVSNETAIARLRQKGQPIRLFGESDKDRRLRLRALELLEREQGEGGGGQGQRNEFQRALKGSERAMEVEEAVRRREGGGAGSKGGSAVPSRTGTPMMGGKGKEKAVEKEGTPLSAGEDSAAAASATDGDESDPSGPVAKKTKLDADVANKEPNPKDEEVIVDLSLVKSNPHKVYPQIYHAFKRVLKEWELSLAARPESVRRSTQGKLAAATHATSAEYLKPLFKQLRKRDLQADVLSNLAEIAHHMQTREYLRANDAYLRLSIGNAPWPIGVTMVGIHERSGREKIFSNNVAHVLNDETSRKYIQSLKRLLTFAQAVRPPDDVSQKMG
ncbi:hypothetical protein JCM11251_003412 [Rhodosporidiobolus azoricus]